MPIISSLQLDSSCPVLPVTCPCPCPCPCPRSASGRGSSSTPAPAPSAASTLCCPRTSPSSLPGTSPAEPALLLLPLPHCTVQLERGCSTSPVLGTGQNPGFIGHGNSSGISPGSCLSWAVQGWQRTNLLHFWLRDPESTKFFYHCVIPVKRGLFPQVYVGDTKDGPTQLEIKTFPSSGTNTPGFKPGVLFAAPLSA